MVLFIWHVYFSDFLMWCMILFHSVVRKNSAGDAIYDVLVVSVILVISIHHIHAKCGCKLDLFST